MERENEKHFRAPFAWDYFALCRFFVLVIITMCSESHLKLALKLDYLEREIL